VEDWETGLDEGLYDEETRQRCKDARVDLEAVRERLGAAPNAKEPQDVSHPRKKQGT